MRALILEANPEIVEERKWRKPSNAMAGVPVWSHNGILCTGETYNKVVKLTFAQGASLPDPSRLFNSSLEGNTRRAIDIREGEKIDARAFKALVKAAVVPQWLDDQETVDHVSTTSSWRIPRYDYERARPLNRGLSRRDFTEESVLLA